MLWWQFRGKSQTQTNSIIYRIHLGRLLCQQPLFFLLFSRDLPCSRKTGKGPSLLPGPLPIPLGGPLPIPLGGPFATGQNACPARCWQQVLAAGRVFKNRKSGRSAAGNSPPVTALVKTGVDTRTPWQCSKHARVGESQAALLATLARCGLGKGGRLP